MMINLNSLLPLSSSSDRTRRRLKWRLLKLRKLLRLRPLFSANGTWTDSELRLK